MSEGWFPRSQIIRTVGLHRLELGAEAAKPREARTTRIAPSTMGAKGTRGRPQLVRWRRVELCAPHAHK